MLKGRCIVVGVTGSIACYKSVGLVSELKKYGADVNVIMTAGAGKFVTSLTFQTVSCNQVYADMFELAQQHEIRHVSLAQKAEVIIVAPATANIIAKFACGIADDPLSTTVLASRAPVLIAPAMNEGMYRNEVLQENIKKLKKRGFKFIGPVKGMLACGEKGEGRMVEPLQIFDAVKEMFQDRQDLKKKKILITAGPTREFIDPVRYISNPSSGKMGFAIAAEAESRGADVVLVSGPVNIKPPNGVKFVSVSSAEEMKMQVKKEFSGSDIVIMTAAVSDWRPVQKSDRKIKKGKKMSVVFEGTEDILSVLGRKKGNKVLVGFALESEDLAGNAGKKLKAKNLDMIVANKVKDGYPFGSETNKVTMISRNGKTDSLPELPKVEIAKKVIDRIVKLIR